MKIFRTDLKILKTIICLMTFILVSACSNKSEIDELRMKLDKIISSKNATFGIGLCGFENQETLFINGDKKFVMMSVVKFPQALAILHQVDVGILDYDQILHFEKSDLSPNTYSPFRDERTEGNYSIKLVDALSYTICKSDNNVCDKFFKILGGTKVAEDFIQKLGLKSITIGTDYANMNTNTIYANESNPKDMVELLRKFYNHELLSKKSTEILWEKMMETSTGPNRIKGLLPAGSIVGHKTGTSGTDENGVTAAYNDIGIVELQNGSSFSIVVFISDSKENDETNANAIAEISKAAFDYFNK